MPFSLPSRKPAMICEYAGHAWAEKSDKWGKWLECQRCRVMAQIPHEEPTATSRHGTAYRFTGVPQSLPFTITTQRPPSIEESVE